MVMENDNARFRKAAAEFVEKAQQQTSVLEIALFGSVAGKDPDPNDLDLAMVLMDTSDIETLAKYSRQMGRHHPAWDLFLFDKDLEYLGRMCHMRDCPRQKAECYEEGCGDVKHIRVDPDFEFKIWEMLSSPIEILYKTFDKNILIGRRKELRITKIKKYQVRKDKEVECIECGEPFIFSTREQKYHNNRGWGPPPLCEKCIEEEAIREARENGEISDDDE